MRRGMHPHSWLALARGESGCLTLNVGIWQRRLPTVWRDRGPGDENEGLFGLSLWMLREISSPGRMTDGIIICDSTGSVMGMVFSSRIDLWYSIVLSSSNTTSREEVAVILENLAHIGTTILLLSNYQDTCCVLAV